MKIAVIIPALNEEAAIGQVVRSVKSAVPGVPVFVIDDYSTDRTTFVAEEAGANVVRLPVHLGLGGCVQTGYKLALELGYDHVVRIDGDGQHEATDIPGILEALETGDADVVIGSRFVEGLVNADSRQISRVRLIGIWLLRRLVAPIARTVIHDPTSGMVGVNRRALEVFSQDFPLAWPEIGALVMLRRYNLRVCEIACVMHPRRTGKSSLTALKSFRYVFHVLLYAFISVLQIDPAPGAKR